MVKRIALIITLCISVIGFGQEDSISKADGQKLQKALSTMYESDIEMDINKTIYTMSQGNSYFTADQKSAIITMAVPSSYEKMKSDMVNQEAKEGMEIIDKGEIDSTDGKKIVFIKSSLEREGEVYIMFTYCKENNEESSIIMTSYFEKGKENQYLESIEKAVFSAQLK